MHLAFQAPALGLKYFLEAFSDGDNSAVAALRTVDDIGVHENTAQLPFNF
jgi:hypothetical protein